VERSGASKPTAPVVVVAAAAASSRSRSGSDPQLSIPEGVGQELGILS